MYISLCQLPFQAKNPFVLMRPNDDCSSNPRPGLRDPGLSWRFGFLFLLVASDLFPTVLSSGCVLTVSSPKAFLEGSRARVVSHPISLQSQSPKSHPHPEGRAGVTSVSCFQQHKDLLLPGGGLAFKCWQFQELWLSTRENIHLIHTFLGLPITSYPQESFFSTSLKTRL